MASFDPNTPLDRRELDHISYHMNCSELFNLGQRLRIDPLAELVRRFYANKDDAPREMLYTWHFNQDPAKERRLMVNALNESRLFSLAETIRTGGWRAIQPLSAQHPSRPRKQTHTQTPAGHGTYMYTTGDLQLSSAPYLSWSSKQQIHIPVDPFDFWHHKPPTPPAPYYQPLANPPQQPDLRIMRFPQQTSYKITEIKLRDVSKELGAEWRMVGTYLGFKNSQIEVMQEQYPVVKECIFQMLLKWRNTNGVKATKTKLKNVLRRSLREDLVNLIDEADDCILTE